MSDQSANKRIAKNTLMLYVRMFFSMAISLFTSRVVLQTLGVEDYGVYNVVGGIVGLIAFLNASMSGATSRFITFELGKGNIEKLQKVFSSAMIVHVFIAIIVLLFAETFGIWFLNNKLVIPEGSMTAAHWVFQFSIISTIVGITQCPYSASIMAYEKMGIYAYFAILTSIFQLLIVYLLVITESNKLILYGALTLFVSVFMAMCYRIYCIKKLPGCRFSFVWDKNLLKTMLSFSGWDLYGNLSVMARGQGIIMLVNMFFGVVANTACGIANQVQSAVGAFSSNVIAAIRPQIIKSYANADYKYMMRLIYSGCRIVFVLILLLSMPILIETHFVLNTWLGHVPQYTVWMCRLTLMFIFVSNLSYIMVTGVHATGDIRRPSFINGTLYLSVVPITYIAYKLGSSLYIPFILNVVFVFIGALSNLYTVKLFVPVASFSDFIVRVTMRCILLAITASLIPLIISYEMQEGWLRFILVTLLAVLSVSILGYFIVFEKTERDFAKSYITKFLSRFKR